MSLELEIQKIIEEQFAALNRSDLIRTPLVAFSSAQDPRFAQLKDIIGPWHQLPTDFLPEAQSVISYFIPFTKEVALGPKREPEGCSVWAEAYNTINAYFPVVNQAVLEYLQSQGYAADSVRTLKAFDPVTFQAAWSHRSAAVIAGLATFGANNLAITDKGSGGRFCSILTSAKLKPGQDKPKKQCPYLVNGSCGLCFRACPAGALTGSGTNKVLCDQELHRNRERLLLQGSASTATVCGKCLSACPLVYIE